MDTTRSDKIVARHRNQSFSAKRKVQRYERLLTAKPKELSVLLCPSREADWIPGWDCDLVYTTTGFVQPDCVFTTDSDNPFGAGTWVIYAQVPGECLELVMTGAHLVLQLRIAIKPAPGGGSRGEWTFTTTGLTPEGNALIETMPERDPRVEAMIDGLEHYHAKGEMRAR